MFDFEEYVESGFAHTGPRNPLRTLNLEDKIVLVSLLTLYLEPCPRKTGRLSKQRKQPRTRPHSQREFTNYWVRTSLKRYKMS